MKGKVKWFNKNKGYGFIITDDNKEYFVHWKSIVTNSPRELKVLEQDELVTFDLMETDKGIQAIYIIRVNPWLDAYLFSGVMDFITFHYPFFSDAFSSS